MGAGPSQVRVCSTWWLLLCSTLGLIRCVGLAALEVCVQGIHLTFIHVASFALHSIVDLWYCCDGGF